MILKDTPVILLLLTKGLKSFTKQLLNWTCYPKCLFFLNVDQLNHNTQYHTLPFMNQLMYFKFFLLVLLLSSQSVYAVSYSLGVDDASDAEFLSGGFAPSVDLDTLNDASSFPKEINLYNWDVQYIRFEIQDPIDFEELSILIDVAWNNGSGVLQLELSILNNGEWQVIDSGDVSNTQDLELTIPAAQLTPGVQELRLRAIDGVEGTSVIAYDQIVIMSKGSHPTTPKAPASSDTLDPPEIPEPASTGRIYFELGQSDSQAGEFFSGDFQNHADVYLDESGAEAFPKELNHSWWPRQFFRFNMTQSQAQKNLVIELDAYWNDGSGHLIIDLLVWDGSDWVTVSSTTVSADKNGRLIVPASYSKAGLNYYQLLYSGGTGGTKVVVWDQIIIQSE